MKNTVFPHKFWRPFLDCMPQLFFRPQYVWFPVHLKGHLIPLCYETLVVNWQNWLFTLFHQSRSVLSPNPIEWELQVRMDDNCRWELDENCLVRIGPGELDENCRWELQGHIWKSHLLLHENCRWESSINFTWGGIVSKALLKSRTRTSTWTLVSRRLSRSNNVTSSWVSLTDDVPDRLLRKPVPCLEKKCHYFCTRVYMMHWHQVFAMNI